MKQIQQGDVCLESSQIPKGAGKLSTLTLAEGEVTGHAHRIVVEEPAVATVFEEKGSLYLKVAGGSVELTHEEHAPLTVEEGEYIVGRVLEYDYDREEARGVAD